MLEMVAFNTKTAPNMPGQTASRAEQGTLVSYSVPWPETDLLNFLNYGTNGPRVYWETNKFPLRFAGFGIATKITATGADRFHAVQQQANRLFENIVVANPSDVPAEVGPRLFGGFSFKAGDKPEGLWSAFPAASFILPQAQITHYQNQTWLTINCNLDPNLECAGLVKHLQAEIEALRDSLKYRQTHSLNDAKHAQPTVSDVMSRDTWCRLVSDATRRIRRGDLEKVVLARARQMHFARPVEPANALTRLAHHYPDTYRFLFEPIPGHAFYGATPELLAEVEGSTLRTVAMAGSIRRGNTPELDQLLGQQLMDNPKERHEHALVVDAIRENLQSRVSELHIPNTPELCRLSNIQHLSTKIKGILTENCGVLPIIEVLHPTPAVGGRARPIALDIINNVEPTARGWYAAPIGWIDHRGNGQFAVAIRSAVSVGSESMLFAGAGIVADSVPEKEWRETELKFKPLADALGGTGD